MHTRLCHLGVLSNISERVRFARRRFGRYEVIDLVAVLFGYAISGERTLQAFYEHLQPFAAGFMALFGREQLPARSTLSRFLASFTQTAVEALRTLFLEDGLSRPLGKERQTGGLVDRAGRERVVFDIDGTREAASQRALPKTPEMPAPQRRLGEVCAPGYTGRKRGEVFRTRTTILQAHTSQWLGSFANPGNRLYQEELRLIAAPWKADRLSGRDFVLQPDGTLLSPANQALSATEQRREADVSLRLVYAARISQCRLCPLREQCQWHGHATTKPRRVSLLLHPLQVGAAPML